MQEEIVETSVSKNLKRKRSKQFLANTPWPWLTKAALGPGKALQVALAIRHQANLEKKKTISLGRRFLGEMNVSKDSKSRALRYLMQAGLIRLEQHHGQNPSVTILEIEDC